MSRPILPPPILPPLILPRRALLLALLPAAALAQPAPPSPPAPAAAPAPRPTLAAVEAGKHYFVFFNQSITTASMRTLDRQIVTLIEGGVTHVTLVLNSPGGSVYETLTAYSLIRALPARIDTHAIGFVASAATTLFLAGQTRTADRNARFLFHPTQTSFNGASTAQDTRDRLAMFGTINGVVSDIIHDRTAVPPEEVERFERQEVFYTAQKALEAGIVHEIVDLRIPGDGQARTVFLD